MHHVTPGKLLEILLPLYTNAAKMSEVPSIMLWGEPGIGKSQTIRKLKDELHRLTGKEGLLRDVRLLLYNPVDLKGIPVPDEERVRSKWLRPTLFDFAEGDEFLHVLMLDEISAAPPSVQAAAYQLILDRQIGDHKLPDNVVVIAAGNRIGDGGVAFRMPTPLRNRMTHFKIEQDLDDWLSYAERDQLHEAVRGFIRFAGIKMLLDFRADSDEEAFPTPRSWEFVSRYLKLYGDSQLAEPAIVGTVGKGAAASFIEYTKVFEELPDLEAIMAGQQVELKSTRFDVICALSIRIAGVIPTMTSEQAHHLVDFLLKSAIKIEHIFMLISDLWRISRTHEMIRGMSSLVQWQMSHKRFFK